MKRRNMMKKWMSCCLSAAMLTVSIPAFPARAEIKGFDYSRITASLTGKPYPVTFEFGGMSFGGRLQCRTPLDQDTIDSAVRTVMEATGIPMSVINEAEETLDKAALDAGVSRDDYEFMIGNILAITTVGIGPIGIDTIYNTVSKTERLINDPSYDLSEFLKDMGIAAAWDGVKFSVGKGMRDYILKWTPEDYDAFFKRGIPKAKVSIFWALVHGIVASSQQYGKDKARWKLRVDAIKAKYLVDAFYEAVNKTIENMISRDGAWRLLVVSERNRYFTFYGVPGNRQTWNVVIDAYNVSDSSMVGTYKGSAAIVASHDMSPFDSRFWDLEMGQFPAGWLVGVAQAGVYSIQMGGGTWIRRSLINNDFTFTISTEDQLIYFRPVSNRGSKIYPISLNDFTDKTAVQCSQELLVSGGINFFNSGSEDLVGYAGAEIHMRVDASESNLAVIGEKLWGVAAVIYALDHTEVDQSGSVVANIWDYTIWKPLESKKAVLKIGNN